MVGYFYHHRKKRTREVLPYSVKLWTVAFCIVACAIESVHGFHYAGRFASVHGRGVSLITSRYLEIGLIRPHKSNRPRFQLYAEKLTKGIKGEKVARRKTKTLASNTLVKDEPKKRKVKSKSKAIQEKELESSKNTKGLNSTRLHLIPVAHDLPRIVDQNGMLWRTNRQLMTQKTRRDGLYDDQLPLDSSSNKTIYHYMDLSPGKSMLRLCLDDDLEQLDERDANNNLILYRTSLGTPIVVDTETGNLMIGSNKTCSNLDQSDKTLFNRQTDYLMKLSNSSGSDNGPSERIARFRYVLDDERWLYHYDRLIEFKRKFGHTRVPQNYAEDSTLSWWVSKQRYLDTQRERGEYCHLTDERKALLESIDFEFDVNIGWNETFQLLTEFYKEHGHTRVPFRKEDSLGSWVRAQRRFYRLGQLSQERIDACNSIDFDWDPYATMWEERYQELKRFHEQHGHCRVPRDENKQLHTWIETQRHQYNSIAQEGLSFSNYLDFDIGAYKFNSTRLILMSRDRIEKLDALGFDWNPVETLWLNRYEQLQQFKEKFGHCNVPVNYEDNSTLGQWVRFQRNHYKTWIRLQKGSSSIEKLSTSMTKQRKKLLDEIGFDFHFNAFEDQWNTKYEEMKAFKKCHGHCRVPMSYEENPSLATWVHTQRQQYVQMQSGKQSTISEERIRLLDDIGFDWIAFDSLWEARYDELCEYKAIHGRTTVSGKISPTLASWVSTQRKQYRLYRSGDPKSVMTEERIQLLKKIGVSFEPSSEAWEDQFQGLKKYKEEHGDCMVPRSYEQIHNLGVWVNNQRQEYKRLKRGSKSSLTEDRMRMLEDLGFVWDPLESQWMEQYQLLVEYIKEFGHSRVPAKWKKNPTLGRWVSDQRLAYKARQKGTSMKMTDERIKLLNAIDFEWTILQT